MDDGSIIDELIKLGVPIAPLQASDRRMWGHAGNPDIYAFDADDKDARFPVWKGSCFPTIVKPEAIVMLHPIVRNYYHIRQIEERTGRVAIAKLGYIELVKP